MSSTPTNTSSDSFVEDYARSLNFSAVSYGTIQQSEHQNCARAGHCTASKAQKQADKYRWVQGLRSMVNSLPTANIDNSHAATQINIHIRECLERLRDLIFDLHCCNGGTVRTSHQSTSLDYVIAICKFFENLPTGHFGTMHAVYTPCVYCDLAQDYLERALDRVLRPNFNRFKETFERTFSARVVDQYRLSQWTATARNVEIDLRTAVYMPFWGALNVVDQAASPAEGQQRTHHQQAIHQALSATVSKARRLATSFVTAGTNKDTLERSAKKGNVLATIKVVHLRILEGVDWDRYTILDGQH